MARLTADQSEMYIVFMLEFDRCWACGWKRDLFSNRVWMRAELHNSHILGGPNRRHDRRNIARLCEGCHRLSHGAWIHDDSQRRLPFLSYANLLWLKKHRDPEFYDRKYLAELGNQRVPYPAQPPRWYRDQHACNSGMWLPTQTYKNPPR